MTNATILEFVNHEELAISVVKYNFPSWGHWHFVIKLIRAGDDSTRIPSAIVETLLEFGTMWIHLGNPMVLDEASWGIAIGIKTRSKGSVTCIVLIKSLHFRVTPLVGRSVDSPIFVTIYSPICRRVYGRSGATLVVIIIDERTVKGFESGERCAQIIKVMFAIKKEAILSGLHTACFFYFVFGVGC